MSKRKKRCIFPRCGNNSVSHPDLRFFFLPTNPIPRKRWCDAMGLDFLKGACRQVCETHFLLQEDMENWMQWKTIGSHVIWKPDAVPRNIYPRTSDSDKKRKKEMLSALKSTGPPPRPHLVMVEPEYVIQVSDSDPSDTEPVADSIQDSPTSTAQTGEASSHSASPLASCDSLVEVVLRYSVEGVNKVKSRMPRGKAVRVEKELTPTVEGTDSESMDIKEELVDIKPEFVDIKPGVELSELLVDEYSSLTEPSVSDPLPADDAKIRVVSISSLRNVSVETENPTGRTAGNATVKNNAPRKTKLGIMQAIYKTLKRVDEEEEDEDGGDYSEDEDGVLSDDHKDEEFPGHLLVGDSIESMLESFNEPAVKKGKFDDVWSDEPVATENAKSPSWFSVTRYPGFIGDPTSYTTEASFFSLLFDDVLVDRLVTYTNEAIKRKSPEDWEAAIGMTNAVEIKAVLGLLLMYGLFRKTPFSPADMFSDCYGPPLFKSSISKNKLEFILRAMSFDHKETRQERKLADKFAAYREFWDSFCANCAKWYSPSEYLTVGESFLGFKGKCPFKIPASRKLRYAMKLISLCDARTFYFCGGVPYLGNDLLYDDDLQLPTRYVIELSEQIQGSERNVTVDDWFSSIELANELKKRNLTMVGAIKKTDEIPSKFLSNKPFSEPQFAYQEDKMLAAFNLNNKNTVILSTLHKNGVCDPQSGKPEVYELYEMTRVGLDVIDRNCESFSSRRTSCRWSMRFFFRTLDLAAHNSYILYQLATNTACRRVDFIKRLALTLTEPLMQQRMYNTRLPKIVRQNVCQVLGVEPRKVVMELAKSTASTTNSTSPLAGRRRCWFCDSKKDRKTSRYCAHCDLPMCSQHTVSVLQCQLCAGEPNEVYSPVVEG